MQSQRQLLISVNSHTPLVHLSHSMSCLRCFLATGYHQTYCCRLLGSIGNSSSCVSFTGIKSLTGGQTYLLVSGMRESRTWGSRRPSLSQGAPSFSPFSWAAGLPPCPGSEPGAGAGVPLRGVPFPSVVSWAPSA